MSSALFSPLRLRDLEAPNRILVSPMCQYSAEQGQATDWHVMHWGALSLSGAGMLCIEATAVEPEGRISLGDLGLWDEATEQAIFRGLAAARKYADVKVLIQLAHAGRKASSHLPWDGGKLLPPEQGGWLPWAPSALAQQDGEPAPRALDAAGLERVQQAFVAAGRRAVSLGLDGIELHCAHGYLLHEFLSPLSNQRSDEYGGSLENRLRFPLQVFDALRAALPAGFPLGVRVSASDWIPGGWDLAQTLEFSRQLKLRGVDWITASSGGISPAQKISVGPGYQVPFAQAIKEATGVTTVAVGLITEPQQAEDILQRGQADVIALARAMLYDPRWGWHAAAALGAQLTAPPQYWRAPPHGHAALFDTARRVR
jgi:2,4-dienoyl-CoA reductase-like NADH-dependent reductase (Old Yellow Enzyme family)